MARLAWLTPDLVTPTDFICRRVRIPNDIGYISAVNGALLSLAEVENWEKLGTATPEEAAENMATMYWDYLFTGSVCMIGSIFPYITTDPPPYALLCDGSTYNREDYPLLYEVLDAAFILDADTFYVPDLRDQFLAGAGLSYAVSETGGEPQVTLSVGEMPSHTHTDSGHVHSAEVSTPTLIPIGVGVPAPAAIPGVGSTGVGSAALSTEGGDEAHENRPPFTALKFAVIAR